MDILHLETEASKLRIRLLKTIPPRNKLFLLYTFFRLLLKERNRNIAESYFLEFGSQYFSLVSKIEVTGVNPALVEGIIKQSKQVLTVYPGENLTNPESCINTLEENYKKLVAALSDGDFAETSSPYLPLLLRESEKFDDDFGILSTLSVQVKPVDDEDKFHIIPRSGEPDAEITNQAKNSLFNAVRIAGSFTKIKHKYWDVYIDFENKTGEYTGSSFGVLLVLKLVEEILRFYDSHTKIYSNISAALTGAVNNDGNVPPLDEKIASVKTKIVFFSDIKQFVIPQEDYIFSRNTLRKLQLQYPDRHLKLIGIQSIDDLFDLRNVVDIKKDSAPLRIGKFIRRQALALFLLIPLTAIIIFSGIIDFDNNPDHFEYKGKVGFIVNKNGKKLFETVLASDYNDERRINALQTSGKLYDINKDGRNEILLCNNLQAFDESSLHKSRITCYDKNLNAKWKFSFDKVVFTRFEHHSDSFDTGLVDTLMISDTLNLFCIARNNPNEVSSVFRLDCQTGKMLSNILWHSGHLQAAGIYRGSIKKEFYAMGINNGFGRSILFCIPIDRMKGQLPCADGYEFLNMVTAHPDQYLLLPKTDFTDYYQTRFNVPNTFYFDQDKNEIFIYVLEGDIQSVYEAVAYRFNKDLKLISLSFGDGFIAKRDALVKAGKIKGPLTITKEYEKSLIAQLRYWDGKKFVTADERFDSSQEP